MVEDILLISLNEFLARICDKLLLELRVSISDLFVEFFHVNWGVVVLDIICLYESWFLHLLCAFFGTFDS